MPTRLFRLSVWGINDLSLSLLRPPNLRPVVGYGYTALATFESKEKVLDPVRLIFLLLFLIPPLRVPPGGLFRGSKQVTRPAVALHSRQTPSTCDPFLSTRTFLSELLLKAPLLSSRKKC